MIAVVVPSIRKEQIARWVDQWELLLDKHKVYLYIIEDGDAPTMLIESYPRCGSYITLTRTLSKYPDKVRSLIVNRNPAVRNWGFYQAIQDGADYILTFDDDCMPVGDPIQDHITALQMRVNKYWMNTAIDGPMMRGYPYADRRESQVVVSHGVWTEYPDLDAPTQLALGTRFDPPKFYRGVVPHGIFMPFCGMNVAFRREAAHFMYWAPTKLLPGAERFDDIWAGVKMVRHIAQQGSIAWVSGYATVKHTRLSNVYENLKREAYGIQIHDLLTHGGDGSNLPDDAKQFFNTYDAMYRGWYNLISDITNHG